MARKTIAEAAALRAAEAAERAAAIAESDALQGGAAVGEGDPVVAQLEGSAQGDEEDFLSALRELDAGNDILWSVHKISGPQETQGFIEKLTSSQLDMQRFRDVYGPGEYKVIGKRGGYYVRGGYKQVKISNVGYKPPGEKQTDADLLRVLEEREERRNAARSAATKEWAAILAPIAAPIIANLFSGKNQVTELVTALGALQGLTPKPKEPPDMMSQLEQISGMMAKLKEMSGDDKPASGSTWIDLIRDALQGAKPVLEGIAGNLMARNAGGVRAIPGIVTAALPGPVSLSSTAPPQPAATPNASSPSTVPPDPAAGVDPVLALIPWLKATVEQMAFQASRDKDPEFYAEVVVDNLPEGAKPDQILGFINRPDWFQLLTQLAPNVAPYQGWFTKFRDAAIELLEEQLQAPKPTPPPPARPTPGPHPAGAPSQVQEFPEEPGGDA